MPAHALLFPAAAAYAAAAVPLSVAAMLGRVHALPGLSFPLGHAHELVFGFALAAVAGNQLGPTRRGVLLAMLAAWLVARVAFVLAPMNLLGALANGAFCAMLAWQILPRMLGRAKKIRNRALPAAVAALCAMGFATEITWHAQAGAWGALLVAILLLSLLMLFMGGRIIAPAAAGQMYRQGGDLAARVQPRLEGASIASMFVAIAASLAGANRMSGIAVLVAALLAAVRIARWRLWALQGRPDLLCLAAGYAWLALGLAAIGTALLRGDGLVSALHLVTVGAIGTLATNVMALTWLRLARRDPARARAPLWSTALVACATLARITADHSAARVDWLAIAAACWCAAWLLLLALFARVQRAAPVPMA